MAPSILPRGTGSVPLSRILVDSSLQYARGYGWIFPSYRQLAGYAIAHAAASVECLIVGLFWPERAWAPLHSGSVLLFLGLVLVFAGQFVRTTAHDSSWGELQSYRAA